MISAPKSGNLIYVDSSVLVSALDSLDENFSQSRKWLLKNSEFLLTSVLAEVEVMRAVLRRPHSEVFMSIAKQIVFGCIRIEITEEVRKLAFTIKPSSIRSLDSIHVATAVLAEIQGFASFDRRQLVAAEEVGLNLIIPK